MPLTRAFPGWRLEEGGVAGTQMPWTSTVDDSKEMGRVRTKGPVRLLRKSRWNHTLDNIGSHANRRPVVARDTYRF